MAYVDHRGPLHIPRPHATLRLAQWLALCLGGGFLVGMMFPPGAWFASLNHPSFAPPGNVFAPVWSTLYVLMAIAAWRIEAIALRAAPKARRMFLIQLGLNFLWTPAFFGLHAPLLALVVVGALAFAVLVTIVLFMRLDRSAALLLLPYLAWVTFATFLNAGYVLLN